MTKVFLLNLIAGILIGGILEASYRSRKQRKLVLPQRVNIQMYALTAVFLRVLSYRNISMLYKSILIVIFTTGVEFMTGYLFLCFRKVRLRDYAAQWLNYKGIICPVFSLYWLLIALAYYYLVLPLFIV